MPHHRYLLELDDLTSAMARCPQKVGFVHKLIVPGWIGFIQDCMIMYTMSKVAKRPIHNGLNYYECCEQIVQLTSNACEARKNSPNFAGKDSTDPDNIAILTSATKALDTWANIYPEIALNTTVQISERYTTNMYRHAKNAIDESIKSILDLPTDINPANSPKPSKKKKRSRLSREFHRDMKAFGYKMAAFVCNSIVLLAIMSLIISITK